MSLNLPPDPEGKNRERATFAREALEAFRRACRCDEEDAVKDLLCNLMHWCDRNGVEFAVAFDAALCAYREETGRLVS
ncbi:hypothetical protein [Burkholderia vietnamiensis]|uniref:hypothetical protein n=1 Tax=Burkholderia vietnamiensis TaxID=60552 RepID=UPI001593D3DF|nr:hypothetical protein [Burkholderia vietnamiensis]MCA8270381.1 hypothetical protein [Burkholderia vietnamiensis]